MSTYRRRSNSDFNIHLAKRMADRKPPQTNIERAQADVNKWLAEQEAYAQRGEKSPWVLAMQKNLDEYKKPHSWLWWKWTFIRNRVYRIGVDVWFDVIKPIRYIDWVVVIKHIFRKRY